MKQVGLFVFGTLAQMIALYLQIYDIAKHTWLRLLLIGIGVVFVILSIWLFCKGAEKRKGFWQLLVEGILLVVIAVMAGDFARQDALWDRYVESRPTEEDDDSWSSFRLFDEAAAAVKKRDYTRAMELARRASEKGYPEAFDLMGWLYAKGLGSEVNYDRAAYYFAQSGRLGSPYFESRLKEFPQILDTENRSVDRDIRECLRNIAVVDSIYNLVPRAADRGGLDAVVALWTKNHDLLEELSKKGFRNASWMLYTRAQLQDNMDEGREMAQRLLEVNSVPDLPRQRFVFYRTLDGDLPDFTSGPIEKDDVDRLLENKDFLLTLDDGMTYERMRGHISHVDLYRYNKAQFERCRYLKNPTHGLLKVYAGDEDLDGYYDLAIIYLNQSVEILERLKDKYYPPVFVN